MVKYIFFLSESAAMARLASTVVYDTEVSGPTISLQQNTLKDNLIFLDRFFHAVLAHPNAPKMFDRPCVSESVQQTPSWLINYLISSSLSSKSSRYHHSQTVLAKDL